MNSAVYMSLLLKMKVLMLTAFGAISASQRDSGQAGGKIQKQPYSFCHIYRSFALFCSLTFLFKKGTEML